MFCVFTNLPIPPALVVLLLVAGMVLVLGVWLRRVEHVTGDADGRICPDDTCGHRNPPQARYCASCGRRLTE